MSANRADVLFSLDAATEHVLVALEHYHSAADQEDAVKAHLADTLIDLRIAKRQAEEIRELPLQPAEVFTRTGSRKRGAHG